MISESYRRLWRRRLRRRPLLPWLAIVTVAWQLLVTAVNAATVGMVSDVWHPVLVGVLVGQIGVLAAWAAAHRGEFWRRYTAGLAGVGLTLVPLLIDDAVGIDMWATLFVQIWPLYTLTVVACALATRLPRPALEFRCPHCGEKVRFGVRPVRSPKLRARLRLTLFDLLGWTTTCAILAAVFSAADRAQTIDNLSLGVLFLYASFALSLAIGVQALRTGWYWPGMPSCAGALLFSVYWMDGPDIFFEGMLFTAAVIATLSFAFYLAGVRPTVSAVGRVIGDGVAASDELELA